jgi:DNA segregation ATPase FtsK/SpoIIIE, S-DNA-T family
VNENEPDIQSRPAQCDTNECGHEAQADAFALLTNALDHHIERVQKAETALRGVMQSANQSLKSRLEDARQRYDQGLEDIQTEYNETKSAVEQKHGSRVEKAKSKRQGVEQKCRSEYLGTVAKAKQIRNESAWLADTVLESAIRREEQDQKKQQKDLTACVSLISDLETALIASLGPKVTRIVGDLPPVDHTRVTEPSFEALNELILEATTATENISQGNLRSLIQGSKKKVELGALAKNKIDFSRSYSDSLGMAVSFEHERRLRAINEKHRSEIEKADHTLRVVSKDSEQKTGARIKEAVEAYGVESDQIAARYKADLLKLDQWSLTQTGKVEQQQQDAVEHAEKSFHEIRDSEQRDYDQAYELACAELTKETATAWKAIEATSERTAWTNPKWDVVLSQPHPTDVPHVIRFAKAELCLKDRLEQIESGLRDQIGLPEKIDTPAVFSLPGPKSLLLTHGVDTRDRALSTLRTLMTRILSSFPAGKARFVMADPIGIGQSFAGFMRLSDQDPSPVGQRIWAEPQQIERQLSDITEHMQTVIQKYLRKDYATVEEYNRAAGEIAEPYRFIVIADLHVALTDAAVGRLKSILESGPRCGVYVLVSASAVEKLNDELKSALDSYTLELGFYDDQSRVHDERVKEVTYTFDTEPGDQMASDIFDRVAQASAVAGRVEVPFDRLSPETEKQWSRTSEEELVIPLGRSGAQKVQELRLGLGTRQHALIAGRTGSGKSTLLHVMITAAAMWYSPDELEMYLIDFKKGVEFKAYTGGRMPHVRAVAIESDREFGLSVLKRLDEELTVRGELFRKLGVQSLENARKSAPLERLPRVMLLIDEFQEFFTEDDEVASEATLLLDRLVRQGRAFGVHVVLGSQTLSGAYSLARSTLGQIGVRIALQCSETDSYLILGEDNNAARLLERPGEAIYNNAGGLVEGNSPFQTAWLSDSTRDECIDALPQLSHQLAETVVFEGNKPANLEKAAAAFVNSYPDRSIPRVLLGDAVAIAPPVAPSLNRRSGANLMIVGPQSEPAMGMLLSSVVTFAATAKSRVLFVDPTPEDDGAFGLIASAVRSMGDSVEVVTADQAVRVVSELNQTVAERATTGGDPIMLVLGGIHRLRSIRKSDDYSFSLDEDDSISPDKELANILLEGPSVGVWTIAWCDTLTNLERAVDRSSIREFGLRAVMQMSASDSTMLLDSSAASALGANRAILANEVSGETMKFRPVSLVESDVVERVYNLLISDC